MQKQSTMTRKQSAAALNHKVCTKTISRMMQQRSQTGSIVAVRKRNAVPQTIPPMWIGTLLLISILHPQLYYDEIAQVFQLLTGLLYTARQIRDVHRQHNYTHRLINEYRPLEQDQQLFEF